jgi:hypothetical protein
VTFLGRKNAVITTGSFGSTNPARRARTREKPRDDFFSVAKLLIFTTFAAATLLALDNANTSG